MTIPAKGRSKRSGVHVSGTNNGNRLLAMNRIVMNGTPRTNSMNTTLASANGRAAVNGVQAQEARRAAKRRRSRQRPLAAKRKYPPTAGYRQLGRPSQDEPRRRMSARIG